jgi:hypothetical protein
VVETGGLENRFSRSRKRKKILHNLLPGQQLAAVFDLT